MMGTITVFDGLINVTESFTLTINAPPNIESIPYLEVTAGTLLEYQVVATDPENDTLTYSLTRYYDGLMMNSTTGVITWPDPSFVGIHRLTVSVTDDINTVKKLLTTTVNTALNIALDAASTNSLLHNRD